MTDVPTESPPRRRRLATEDDAPKTVKAKPAKASKVRAQPAPEPQAEVAPAPEPAAQAPEPEPKPEPAGPAMGFIPGAQREALEKLSMNLARAALTAQGAIAEAALRQADRPPALSADPFHLAPSLTEVMGRLAAQPDRLMRAQADLFTRYLELWQNTARRLHGAEVEPVVKPAKNDKRFADPDWSENPVFDMMKQSYLLTTNWLTDLVGGVTEVDPVNKRRVEFFMKMLTDAFSPSNFLLSNPEALRSMMQSGGESLVKGMENFAHDLERGGGHLAIAQTDYEQFKVGENVATAPGKVIFRNELIEILQFSPSTDQVFQIPLLIFPPWINKYYIMDLRPENSMIRWLAAQGFTVFVTSWVNPDTRLAQATMEDYLRDGVYAALEVVLKQTGAPTANTVGYCIGGTLLSTALGHMAARGDERISSATFFAAQQDFSEAGDLLVFTNNEWLDELDKRMETAGGVLPGQSMADTFNSLRANDLIWSFFVNNYLLGKEPRPFDLLFWNSDQTRMPRTLHMNYLRDFYRDNKLAKGEFSLAGERIDLSKVKTPVYVQSSKEDHIAPFPSVYKGARLFGGPVTFTLAGSGHIAGVINHPDAKKYQHWINPALPATPGEWQAGAVEHPGSWWNHWSAWLQERSGGKVPARDPANGVYPAIGDAPGDYVKIKS